MQSTLEVFSFNVQMQLDIIQLEHFLSASIKNKHLP